MTRFTTLAAHVLTLLMGLSLVVTPLVADAQPEGKGKGKGSDKSFDKGFDKGNKGFDKGDKGERRPDYSRSDDRRDGRDRRDRVILQPRAGVHFIDPHRGYVREYYVEEYRRGFCPPGLAKRNNGCMPPGQAKKWDIGRPLPRDVIFHDLPPRLVVQIGTPPPGYRYVRVAADILLIAIGTGMVIDAIQDLGRM